MQKKQPVDFVRDAFIDKIDENINFFSKAIEEHLAVCENGREMTNAEFSECFCDGVRRVTNAVEEWVRRDLLNDNSEYKKRYLRALRDPRCVGYNFKDSELTIGKIFIFYIWAIRHKRAPKSDCIKIEKHAMQMYGLKCVEADIVH